MIEQFLPIVILINTVNFFWGIVILKKARHKDAVNFSSIIFLLILWTFLIYSETIDLSRERALTVIRFDFLLGSWMGFFFFKFAAEFVYSFKHIGKIIWSVFGLGLVFSVAALSAGVIDDVIIHQGEYYATPGYLYIPYLLYINTCVLLGVGSLFVKYRQLVGVEKKQAFYILIGLSMTAVLLVWFNLLLPTLTGDGSMSRYTVFATFFFSSFTSYTILKYRLLNAKVIFAEAASVIILLISFFQLMYHEGKLIYGNNTYAFMLIFGLVVANNWSVQKEVKRKDELEDMTEKLTDAYQKLQQLDRAKSEFVTIASHQLRTPLTAIKGYMSMMIDGTYGKISKDKKQVLEKVYISNERLIHLVEDLLNISRIESGRMTFKFQKNDIVGLVTEVVENLRFAFRGKGLSFEYRLPLKPIHPFYFDREKLHEVVNNLIDNAIKYTPQGGIKVSIYEIDHAVRVEVRDTGIGIDRNEVKYIFEKFQRGDQVSKVNTEGVGLGLYVANKIVAAHKGSIWAESEGRGKGSCFILELKKDFRPSWGDAEKKMQL